jgi:hypothetical protein
MLGVLAPRHRVALLVRLGPACLGDTMSARPMVGMFVGHFSIRIMLMFHRACPLL